jgi:hypothetical protein
MLGCVAQAESEAIAIDPGRARGGALVLARALVQLAPRRAGSAQGHAGGAPPPFAIAHHLIRAWVETDAGGR